MRRRFLAGAVTLAAVGCAHGGASAPRIVERDVPAEPVPVRRAAGAAETPPPPNSAAPATPAPVAETASPTPSAEPRTANDPAVRRASADDSARVLSDMNPSEGLPAAEIVALVGDGVITLRQLQVVVAQRLKDLEVPNDAKVPREQLAQIGKASLDSLIDRTLAVQEAHRVIKNDKQWNMLNDYIEGKWKSDELPRLFRRYKVTDEFELKEAIEQKHKAPGGQREPESLSDLKKTFKDEAIAKEIAIMSISKKREEPTKTELETYYREHLGEYERPAAITWREIVIPVGDNGDRAAARQRAAAIRDRLLRGADFAAVATKESVGASAKKGGLWEWTTPGSYAVADVNRAIDTLDAGAISGVIDGPSGEHIIRVEARRPAGPQPFIEVQRSIGEAIYKNRMEKALSDYFESLRAKSRVTILITEDT